MAGKDEDKPFIQKHAALIPVAIFLVVVIGVSIHAKTKNKA